MNHHTQFYAMLEIDPKASCMLGKRSTAEIHPRPLQDFCRPIQSGELSKMEQPGWEAGGGHHSRNFQKGRLQSNRHRGLHIAPRILSHA